jgi:hypothetical protein
MEPPIWFFLPITYHTVIPAHAGTSVLYIDGLFEDPGNLSEVLACTRVTVPSIRIVSTIEKPYSCLSGFALN